LSFFQLALQSDWVWQKTIPLTQNMTILLATLTAEFDWDKNASVSCLNLTLERKLACAGVLERGEQRSSLTDKLM
jgi:hypothetical protein